MRKRNVHVQFWLDKKEAEAFNKKVKRSGLSREAYLRHLVNGLVPQDAPPPAYYPSGQGKSSAQSFCSEHGFLRGRHQVPSYRAGLFRYAAGIRPAVPRVWAFCH